MFLELIKGAVMMVFGKQSTTFGIVLTALKAVKESWDAYQENDGDWASFAVDLIYPYLPESFRTKVDDALLDDLLAKGRDFIGAAFNIKELLKS